MLTEKEKILLSRFPRNTTLSSREIHERLPQLGSFASAKRVISSLVSQGFILSFGAARNTTYQLGFKFQLLEPIDMDKYFEQDIDSRGIADSFNLQLIGKLNDLELFDLDETKYLNNLHKEFKERTASLSESNFMLEMERLAIDLSWKSSQIEGNTYSLLETERLIKDRVEADGKRKDEAIMLLNHKAALDFILSDPKYVDPLMTSRIEDIHSLLIKDLKVDRNIRNRRVGISGTNYRPLDNEFQIREAFHDMCTLVNSKKSVFDKALLLLVLISYIQAFNDGNKRTARIISNAIMISNDYCPLSFRTIDSIEYKKAMLIFYEQNNITAFKKIFMDQYAFAVDTYF